MPAVWSGAGEPRQRSIVLSLKVSPGLAAGIAEQAARAGLTMKQVVTTALRQAGLPVSPLDLADRSPRRRADRMRAMAAAAE